MRVLCRLSWEEESNVSTGDDNSPAGKCEFFTYQVAVNFCESFNVVFCVN